MDQEISLIEENIAVEDIQGKRLRRSTVDEDFVSDIVSDSDSDGSLAIEVVSSPIKVT